MPGYGSGPFGGEPFGEFNWARRVLFDLAPVLYREEDVDDLFLKYADSQGEVFTDLRRQIRNFFELREARAVRTQFDETGLLLLGAIQLIKEPVEQTGIRGSVTGVSVFQTERGRFTFADVGKELTVTNSTLADNNTSVVITSVVDSTSVLTNPPLVVDAGPLRWEVRPVSASLTNETIVEVVSGDVEPIGPGWILSDGSTEFEVTERKQFFNIEDERKLQTEREGQDGAINASLRLTSPTAAFQRRDVGKRITVSGSTALKPAVDSSNEGKFTIVELISATEVVLDSPFLFQEVGPLTWAILRRPQLTLSGTSTLRGAVEQSGEDMTTIVGPLLQALSGAFSSADIGKLVTVYAENDINNGVIFEVTGAPTANQLEVTPNPTLTGSTYRYELRAATTEGDTRQVSVRAPGLLRWLAQDFGIEIDVREEEEFQRRWVESVSRWIGLKGTVKGYQYLAALTGYSPTTVEPLYRVTLELYQAVLTAGGTAYAVGEGLPGADGSLNLVSGRVRFSSPTAAFTAAHVGRAVETTGTGAGTNDGFRVIDLVIDAHTIAFRPVDTMGGTADANNGAIVWRLVRFYSVEAPLIPVYDEINADRMEYLKTSAVFTVDKYCWEQSPSPWSTLIGFGADGLIEITGVTPTAASAFPTTYTLRGQGDFDVVTGLGVGRWKLTNFGTEYFLETVPKFPLIRSGAIIDPTGANLPAGTELEDVDAFEIDTSVAPFTVTATDGLGTFGNVRPGDIFVVTGESVRVPPGALPAKLLDGWRVASVAPDGSSFELDASYTLASTGLPSFIRNVKGTVIEVFNDGTAHSGVDGSLTGAAPARLTIGSVGFDPFADDGKRALVFQSGSGNNGTVILDTYVSGTDFDLDPTDTPTTPDANNAALTWALVEFEFQVVATTPPSTGVSTIEYICAEVLSCDFCKSHRIRIETTTPYVLEGGIERLRDRIGQTTPEHVEVVEAYGVRPLATLAFSASGSSTFP